MTNSHSEYEHNHFMSAWTQYVGIQLLSGWYKMLTKIIPIKYLNKNRIKYIRLNR